MLDCESWEFPEIEEARAAAYEAVQEWIALKQRWEAQRGAKTPLPIEAYVDHPAYAGLRNLIEYHAQGVTQPEALEAWVCDLLSAINQEDGSILISGLDREGWEKRINLTRQLVRISLEREHFAEAIRSDLCQKTHSLMALLLWDEDVFFTPLSIRMRLEVNNAE